MPGMRGGAARARFEKTVVHRSAHMLHHCAGPETEAGGEELVKLITAKQLGAPLSLESIHRAMAEKGLTELSLEEEIEKIMEEAGLELGGGGSSAEDGPEDDEDEPGGPPGAEGAEDDQDDDDAAQGDTEDDDDDA